MLIKLKEINYNSYLAGVTLNDIILRTFGTPCAASDATRPNVKDDPITVNAGVPFVSSRRVSSRVEHLLSH